MTDYSRSGSPSRKSRFRAVGRARPAVYSPETVAPEEGAVEGEAASQEANFVAEPDLAAASGRAEEGQSREELEAIGDPPPPAMEVDAIPAGLRLTRDPDGVVQRTGWSTAWVSTLAGAALLLGLLGGYLLASGRSSNASVAAAPLPSAENKIPSSINPDTLAEIDTAFEDTKRSRFKEARDRFEKIYAAHPEWPSIEIEAARAALYYRNFQASQALLAKATQAGPNADAALLTALLHLANQEYAIADTAFAAAAATDPVRADVYYFWGENLRREGKPIEAAAKFKEALSRNQYENSEPLYRLKYWISLVQANLETSTGEGAIIDASLASPHPTGAALFAGAARAIRGGDYKAADGFLTRAQVITDPTVFSVILRDPTFLEANQQPDLAHFYK